jgi:hypothetical protein
LVLLTWRSLTNPDDFWIHDHAIGLGSLITPKNADKNQVLQVIESTAMLPTGNLPEGEYELKASFLDYQTGKTEEITVPKFTITLDNKTPKLSSPNLDFVTQLRQLALNLPKGVKGLDPVFRRVDRLNVYDPTQDYLKQVDVSLGYRLQEKSQNSLDWTYAQVLARVLQQNPQAAIAALQSLVKLDPNNPYYGDQVVANLNRSQGLEGLGFSPDRQTIYPMLEGTVVGDPAGSLRIYKFDVASGQYQGLVGRYQLSSPSNAPTVYTQVESELVAIRAEWTQTVAARVLK